MINDVTALLINAAFYVVILLATWVAVFIGTRKYGIEHFLDDRLKSYSAQV